jgi:hypothetical protein
MGCRRPALPEGLAHVRSPPLAPSASPVPLGEPSAPTATSIPTGALRTVFAAQFPTGNPVDLLTPPAELAPNSRRALRASLLPAYDTSLLSFLLLSQLTSCEQCTSCRCRGSGSASPFGLCSTYACQSRSSRFCAASKKKLSSSSLSDSSMSSQEEGRPLSLCSWELMKLRYALPIAAFSQSFVVSADANCMVGIWTSLTRRLW